MSAAVERALAVFAGGENYGAVAFSRTCTRAARLKRLCDCGHHVDGSKTGSELYRYQVWKIVGERGVQQRTDCEPCARTGSPVSLAERWRGPGGVIN